MSVAFIKPIVVDDAARSPMQRQTFDFDGGWETPFAAAVAALSDGDTLTLPGPITIRGDDFLITESITLEANGATIKANSPHASVIEFSGSLVVVNDLTVDNNDQAVDATNVGRGIYASNASGDYTFNNCVGVWVPQTPEVIAKQMMAGFPIILYPGFLANIPTVTTAPFTASNSVNVGEITRNYVMKNFGVLGAYPDLQVDWIDRINLHFPNEALGFHISDYEGTADDVSFAVDLRTNVQAAIDAHNSMYTTAKATNENVLIGHYGLGVRPAYEAHGRIAQYYSMPFPPDQGQLDRIGSYQEAENIRIPQIRDHVDFFMPSHYPEQNIETSGEPHDRWKTSLFYAVRAARIYAPGVPYLPTIRMETVPPETRIWPDFNIAMEACRKVCDGFVLWFNTDKDDPAYPAEEANLNAFMLDVANNYEYADAYESAIAKADVRNDIASLNPTMQTLRIQFNGAANPGEFDNLKLYQSIYFADSFGAMDYRNDGGTYFGGQGSPWFPTAPDTWNNEGGNLWLVEPVELSTAVSPYRSGISTALTSSTSLEVRVYSNGTLVFSATATLDALADVIKMTSITPAVATNDPISGIDFSGTTSLSVIWVAD